MEIYSLGPCENAYNVGGLGTQFHMLLWLQRLAPPIRQLRKELEYRESHGSNGQARFLEDCWKYSRRRNSRDQHARRAERGTGICHKRPSRAADQQALAFQP